MVAAILLQMLRTSPLLQAIPDVRRQALRESVRSASSVEAVTEILLANLTGSPYIPDEVKTKLASLVIEQQWGELGATLQWTPEPSAVALGEAAAFDDFRSMVIGVFSRSRRLAVMDYTRRHRLGSAIYQATTRDGLVAIAMGALENAQTLDSAGRERVANDILDGRFDRLLLPDRFDCDERPRHHQRDGADGVPMGMPPESEPDECPVCLGTSLVERRLPCAHTFCDACITQWAGGRAAFPCPLCRAETSLASCPRV
jgi:hypothetical protein